MKKKTKKTKPLSERERESEISFKVVQLMITTTTK